MGWIRKTKAERIQELLDYIEPLTEEGTRIVFGDESKPLTDEENARLDYISSEELRVNREINRILAVA